MSLNTGDTKGNGSWEKTKLRARILHRGYLSVYILSTQSCPATATNTGSWTVIMLQWAKEFPYMVNIAWGLHSFAAHVERRPVTIAQIVIPPNEDFSASHNSTAWTLHCTPGRFTSPLFFSIIPFNITNYRWEKKVLQVAANA